MLIYCCELYILHKTTRPVVAFPILIIIIIIIKKTKKTKRQRRHNKNEDENVPG